MKAIVLVCVFVSVYGSAVYSDGGAQNLYKLIDGQGQYSFGYNEGHNSGGSFRREKKDAFGTVSGSYGLHDADGRIRIVNYVADANGFRANIKTNEPGVESQDSASTTINKQELPLQYAPVYASLPIYADPEPHHESLIPQYVYGYYY